MRFRLRAFLGVVIFCMLAVPAFNIGMATNRESIRWTDRTFLYNVDFAMRWLARVFYPLGISVDPTQVVIGRQGWLYLGDKHANTLTADRLAPTTSDAQALRAIVTAQRSWQAYFERNGVKHVSFLVAPNKPCVYPEYLPAWAASNRPNQTDTLFTEAGAGHFVDIRTALRNARQLHPDALYFKTDSHWNFLGAGVAFREFAKSIRAQTPDIVWPADDVYATVRVLSRDGGDLAGFLRLKATLGDSEPMIRALDLPLPTTHSDFESGRTVFTGPNGSVAATETPVLVNSKLALNNQKVLWVRDSFGVAMAPLMALTFSDVIHIHWRGALGPKGQLQQLVAQWKPDYVFFMIAERDLRDPMFALTLASPPPAAKESPQK